MGGALSRINNVQQPINDFTTITSTTWPLTGQALLGHLFTFSLAPGATRSLAYFLYRGLPEGKPSPQDCAYYGGCFTPATGAQVSEAHATLSNLAADPPFCDLTPAVSASLVNWPNLALNCHDNFLPVLMR